MKRQPQKYYRLLIFFVCTVLIAFVGQVAIAQSNYRWGNPGKQSLEMIVGGDFVVTMNEAQPVIKNGAIAIKDGKAELRPFS